MDLEGIAAAAAAAAAEGFLQIADAHPQILFWWSASLGHVTRFNLSRLTSVGVLILMCWLGVDPLSTKSENK
jgi:ABC-type Fe3+-siderophore transport system permease subunit